jgi:hypothetical protein
VAHTLVIRFVPNLFVEGPLPAFLGGLGAAWGYDRLRPRLPGLAGGAALGALAWAPVLGLAGVAWLTGPMGASPAGIAGILAGIGLALLLAAGLGAALAGRGGARGLLAASALGTVTVGGALLEFGAHGRPVLLLAALLPIEVAAGLAIAALPRPQAS